MQARVVANEVSDARFLIEQDLIIEPASVSSVSPPSDVGAGHVRRSVPTSNASASANSRRPRGVTCVNCEEEFEVAKNTAESCHYHDGRCLNFDLMNCTVHSEQG